MNEKPTYEELEQRIREFEQAESEHDRTEEALRESQERFQLLYERAPLGYQSLDEDGCFIEVNPAWLDILGYSREEVIGKSFSEFLHPDWADHFKEYFPRFKAVGEVLGIEFEMAKKDGQFILVSFTGKIGKDRSGNFQQTHCILQNITGLRQVEETLRKSEEQYKSLFKNMLNGFALHEMVFDEAGTPIDYIFLDVNEAFENQTNFKKEDLIGRKVTEALPGIENDPIDWISTYGKVVLTGNSISFENYAEPLNRWYSVVAYRPNEGQFAVIFLDITDRKRVEEALRESEERANKYLEIAGVVFVALNYEGDIALINERGLEILGYQREELLGKNWFKTCLPENVRDDVLEVHHQLMRGEVEPVKYHENPILRKDGKERIIAWHNSIIRDESGHITETLASGIDITDRKQAEEALQESEEKYRTILDEIDEGYFEVDLNGRFTFVSDWFLQITGYSKDELLKMNYRDYMTPESVKKIYSIFTELARTREPVKNVGHEVLTPEGELRHLELSASLIQDREGNPIGFRGTTRDVSERKKAEEERAKLETQLQQAQRMESLGTLAGGIAHNFNNVLMAIQGRTALMIMDKVDSDPDFEHLKGIEESVQNAAELTKDLLGFARGGKYEPRVIDLNELIKHENQMFGRTKKEVTLRGKYNKGLWTVEVDQGQIRQILLNLYVNAWQAMPDGGDLYIQTENVTVDEGYVKPYEVIPGKYVKISVTDTGVGMDKATREKIFDPFFTTQEIGVGTGLGLASVYGIVKNHGGFINVYSEKGEGTTFNIYLPASEKGVVEEKKAAREVVEGEGTILLVDDEEMITEVGELLLEKLGYRVLIAKSGQEAIDVYGMNMDDIGLVILDMIMPGMGGGETYDRLKEINSDIKVLLSSGYSINGQAREILDRGCNGFIQKPFSMNEISQIIKEHLDKG